MKKTYIKGNIFVPCKEDSNDPLVKTAFGGVAAPAGAVTTFTYTVPTGRGDINAVALIIGSTTVADLANAVCTLSANGISLIEEVPLLEFSTLYADNSRRYTEVFLPEKSILKLVVTNAGANPIPVFASLMYVSPFQDCK
jgi:hypothetical protein